MPSRWITILLFAPLVLGTIACGDRQPPPQKADAALVEIGERPGTTYVFACEDLEFVARIEGEIAWLFLPGGTIDLPHVPAASGVKYSDGQVVFWTHGELALLEYDGTTYRDCRNRPDAAVWEDAKLRGVDFRAVGREPGWLLEISRGVQILFVTDYGAAEVSLIADEPQSFPDPPHSVWRAGGNGHELVVRLEPGPCNDTMTEATYATSATVTLDGKDYHGCGRALH